MIGDVHEWVARLHDEYGDVVRMAPDELSFTSGQAVCSFSFQVYRLNDS